MRSLGFRLPDGTIVEQVYDPRSHVGAFVIRYSHGALAIGEPSFRLGERDVLPFLDSIVRAGAVVLPADVGELGSRTELIEEVRSFIATYVDLPGSYDYVAAAYVMLSWVYDAFQALPYLHLEGRPDSGKSRALVTIGALCYHAIFATGAITPAAIFRMLDRYRGTLVLDEADFGGSSVWADILKILNSGYQAGFPVIRIERAGRDMEPRTYEVFGPKVISTRRPFEDDALVSRCLLIPLRTTRRRDIPLNLPPEFNEAACRLRNKLLAYRLRYRPDLRPEVAYLHDGEEPRIAQILMPLRQVAPDRQVIDALETGMHNALLVARGATPAGQVVRAIFRIHAEDAISALTMQTIADEIAEAHGDPRMNARRVADVVRRDLGLAPLIYRVPGRNLSAIRWDEAEMTDLGRRFGMGGLG